jgi:serralysin
MGIDLISLDDPSSNLTADINNTADYSQSSSGIIANLATAQVLIPIYEVTEQPKILAIGDSITSGEHPIEPTPGAYRLQLQNDFVADDLSVDFIGSQTNQETDLNDPEHEGHPGWTINKLTALLDQGLLTDYQPDIVLLMAGTNDVLRHDQASEVIDDLNQIIDRLQAELPSVPILVSSIPPIDPTLSKGEQRASVVEEVNAQLPELVEQKGSQVTYVNGGGSLDLDDLVADGIHPNAAGYQEIGDAWYDSLVKQDTLTGIDEITGTAYSDRLTGNDQANSLSGGEGNDVLHGGLGNDTIYGDAGSDILIAGAGADVFVFGFSNDFQNGYVDKITDFDVNEDRLAFSASDFNGGLVTGTNLTEINSETGVLINITNPYSLGTSASFFYENDTGILSFDPDGSGSVAISEIAVLSNIPSLSKENIVFVA